MKTLSPQTLYGAMASSFLVIVLLSFWPIDFQWRMWRPEWLILWLLFWSLHQPRTLGIWSAFVVGLVWDVLTGSLLGSYALSSSVLVYLSRRLGRNWLVLNLFERGVLLLLLIVTALAVRLILWYWVQHISLLEITAYVYSLLASIAVWPLIHYSLARWQRRM